MSAPAATRRDLIREFLRHSPLPLLLGIETVELGEDRAVLRMPYRPELATFGDVLHGGAIATLLDTAGMAGAWSNDDVPESFTGSTVDLSLSFVAAARAEELTAVAQVIRRGRSLCFVAVSVHGGDERVVAQGQITYKYG